MCTDDDGNDDDDDYNAVWCYYTLCMELVYIMDVTKHAKKYKFLNAWYRCTGAGLKQITCPSGLAFDIEKQTCDWKAKVDNCGQKESKLKMIKITTLE